MMATDTRPSAQDLCKLIDSLIAASDLAGEGNVQAVETSLQCFNSLKQLQVRLPGLPLGAVSNGSRDNVCQTLEARHSFR